MYNFLFILFLAQTTWAFDFSYKLGYEGYFLFVSAQHPDTGINLGNEILKTPDYQLISEQRLDFKFNINDAKIILRPFWNYNRQKIKTNITQQNYTNEKNKVDFYDLFFEQIVNSKLSFTLGLQTYQWGPAELINPSNPFYHFQSQQGTFGFKSKGKSIARFNLDLTSGFNYVVMYEPVSNQEANWIYNQDFKPQHAMKIEKQFDNTRNMLGLVWSHSDSNRESIGEYAQYEFYDGYTIYIDGVQNKNVDYYRPEYVNGFYKMSFQREQSWSSLLTVGARFESDFDLRLEYIYNSLGFDQDEFAKVVTAIQQTSVFLSENLKAFQNNGLELLTQHYAYLSLRKSDFLSFKEFNLYLRTFNSLTDHSAVDQIEIDKGAGDYLVAYAQISAYRGSSDTEFKLSDNYKGTVGFKLAY